MNEATEGDSAYNTALEEYEDVEGTIEDLEGDLAEFEETLAGLEQDQIWDDLAAIHDEYELMNLTYDMAVERESTAQDRLELASTEL
jgi:predicted  nucleic acid-binding Zn-ribbon protein